MFYKLSELEEAENALLKRLVSELESNKQVLWLVSGGSNIDITVSIMSRIPEELTINLSIMLIDERYGAPGHKRSNWQQLRQAGFSGKQAHLMPVLLSNSDLDRTAMHYNNITAQAFAENDILIAQLGIGVDGEIAGILPYSEAAANNQQLAIGYKHKDCPRLTLTFSALEMMDAIYVYVYGETKRETLIALKTESISPREQPAQFLKDLPEVYLFNDQVGEA
jgi:6-phosphogluconolactonase/glucosamine-6-phosphate isomerase/deaminase